MLIAVIWYWNWFVWHRLPSLPTVYLSGCYCFLYSVLHSWVSQITSPQKETSKWEEGRKESKNERRVEKRKERDLGWSINLWDTKENMTFFSPKKVSHKSLSHFTGISWRALSFFSHPHSLLFSFQYNNSNYVQTTKHASSNDSADMGKLAHLHNNKCRFEPIESLLTFKWYKDVISKVCAYPGWLSVWMCREWSNSQCAWLCPVLLSVTRTTLLTVLCNWGEKGGCKGWGRKWHWGELNEDGIGWDPLW